MIQRLNQLYSFTFEGMSLLGKQTKINQSLLVHLMCWLYRNHSAYSLQSIFTKHHRLLSFCYLTTWCAHSCLDLQCVCAHWGLYIHIHSLAHAYYRAGFWAHLVTLLSQPQEPLTAPLGDSAGNKWSFVLIKHRRVSGHTSVHVK